MTRERHAFPSFRIHPLAAALAAALLMAGCATHDPRPAPMDMPEMPLVRGTTLGNADLPGYPAQGAARVAVPPPSPPRDLGPIRMRAQPGPQPGPQPAAQAHAGQADAGGERVSLNFVDADLPAVVRALARFTGRNFIVDPRVKGQLTLVSEAPVNAATAYQMLVGALRMQGFAIVESGGISRVVPEADAKLLGGAVAGGPDASTGGGLVTRVFTLQYENAANLVPVPRPMIAPSNPINAYPNNNTLVVTDYADNMERIAQVIAGIDTPASLSADIIPVRHGVASDIAVLVGQLLDGPQGAQGADATQRVTVIADPRSNSVLVRASSPARAQLARDLVLRMDNPNTRPGNLHVVYLRNAQAVKLAEVLRGSLTGQSNAQAGGGFVGGGSGGLGGGDMLGGATRNAGLGAGGNRGGMLGEDTSSQGLLGSGASLGGAGAGGATQGVAFSAGGATVQADPTTNTLIISAPEPLYRSLREVIDQLDQRRAQVLVESLIVEVTSENAAEFGIQWMTGGGGLDGSGTSFIGGQNLGGSGINPNAATTLDALAGGLSLGVVRGTVNVLGQEIVNLGVLARALQRVSGTNILSTPNLMTLDNEQASIVVGRTVPFVTGSYVTNSGDGAGNPFQTIEREDVGLTLRLRPQISEGGTVKLDLYQEVSSIDETATTSAGIITRKRALETSVLVDNGQIIVLGGLLEDSGGDSTQSVPILGSLPVLGSLFRYDRRQRTKTNLMIFLRPHIVRTAGDGSRVSLDRYDYMRRVQDNARPEARWPLPVTDAPLLPALDTQGQPASPVPLDPALPGRGTAPESQPLDLRSENQERTLRQAAPPATRTTTEVHAPPPALPAAAAPAEGPPRIAALAAEDVPRDGPAVVLEVANVPSQQEAQRIVQRIRATGLNAYTQVAPGGTGTLVRTRVARNESAQAAQALLRGLGYDARPL
ncbi:type II secretion system secretin GspD [Orrella sp. JC864]|uniref:type II secretion system secretin GspD n=1 Tax=Orrella sp. JC864 TaxID=3120298 RepID=UPI0030087E9E